MSAGPDERLRAAHRRAAETHIRAAALHEAAAGFWQGKGDERHAAYERRKAQSNRDGAELEGQRERHVAAVHA